MNLNRAMIIGNLTRDPEVRNTATGKQVASFSVATNRVWKNDAGVKQEEVEYHNIVAWGRLAEIAGQYLKKGRKIYVEGRLKTRDWVGQDGVKRNRTEIIADNFILLDRAPAGSAPMSGGDAASAYARPTETPSAQATEMTSKANAAVVEEEIKIEDIPF